jgi:hypothetical protein
MHSHSQTRDVCDACYLGIEKKHRKNHLEEKRRETNKQYCDKKSKLGAKTINRRKSLMSQRET